MLLSNVVTSKVRSSDLYGKYFTKRAMSMFIFETGSHCKAPALLQGELLVREAVLSHSSPMWDTPALGYPCMSWAP